MSGVTLWYAQRRAAAYNNMTAAGEDWATNAEDVDRGASGLSCFRSRLMVVENVPIMRLLFFDHRIRKRRSRFVCRQQTIVWWEETMVCR